MSALKPKLLLLFFSIWSTARASNLKRRDNTAQAPLSIPLVLDGNQRYAANVNMSSGPNTQSFGWALSTGTGYCMVAGTTCNSCSNATPYNMSASSTAQNLTGGEDINFYDGFASGNLFTENCKLHQSNGSAWSYPNQTIVLIDDSTLPFSSNTSGIFALGTNSRNGDFSNTIFGKYFSRNPSKTNFTFALALNSPSSNSTDGGVLHWLGSDPNFFSGNVSWTTVAPSNLSNPVESDWSFEMDGWSFESGSSVINNNGGNLATTDPFYPNVYIPQSEAQAIYGLVSGAAVQSTSDLSKIWSVPCSTKMEFTVKVDGQSFSLNEDSLVLNTGNGCIGAIQGWADTNRTDFLLGATFISYFYLIFVVSPYAPNIMGFVPRSSSHSVGIGAIVGIAAGSLAALGAIIFAVLFTLHRRRALNKNQKYSSIGSFEPERMVADSTLSASSLQSTFKYRVTLEEPPASGGSVPSRHWSSVISLEPLSGSPRHGSFENINPSEQTNPAPDPQTVVSAALAAAKLSPPPQRQSMAPEAVLATSISRNSDNLARNSYSINPPIYAEEGQSVPYGSIDPFILPLSAIDSVRQDFSEKRRSRREQVSHEIPRPQSAASIASATVVGSEQNHEDNSFTPSFRNSATKRANRLS